MSLKEQLSVEIDGFLNNSDKSLKQDKKKALLEIFDKYLNLNTSNILLDKSDFDAIKSQAVRLYVDRSFPKYVGPTKRVISSEEANILCLIESTISQLHLKECLKKLPKFDYRD